MRHLTALAVLLGSLPVACGSEGPSDLDPSGVGTSQSDIIGGTLDAMDRSVLELFYATSYPLSACGGNATCLQGCTDLMTGQACTSGANCTCGSGATCTGELIGPHTVVTAGHCTDLSAGGEVSGPGRPALTICSSAADVMAVAEGNPTSDGCNLVIFVLFNNACTTNDTMDSCESGLINAGSYVVADSVTNPGYNGSINEPYTATNNDNDIGLVHLASSTLKNGQAEPGILTFNRASLGAACTDLGSLRFVGYGVTDPSEGMNAISGVKYDVSHDVRVKDTWHNEEDGAQASALSTCGPGSGDEPTCSGDSGGPSFNSAGVIIGVTSLGDPACTMYGQDTRIDAYANWIDGKMASWGDPMNGGGPSTPADASADAKSGNAQASDAGKSGGDSSASGNAGAASEDADTGHNSAADDASGSSGAGVSSGKKGGGGGCAVSATGSGNAGPGTALLSLMFAASFLSRRRKDVP
jgi:MYXO-CTERM domain-containing protein